MTTGDPATGPGTVDPWPDVRSADRHWLRQGWRKARSADERRRVEAQAEASAAATRERWANRPAIELAAGLPVTERADDLERAIREHQVIVVCGETGSGKTTQLPKILMRAGLGARGLIGHTQPRRLAARSVATRIAEEVGRPLGDLVGFQTRFDNQVSDATQVKLMTDGILLAETGRDRFLNRYEAIVIDEAHERSLNIDFLLGYLKRLLPKRPDLKLIITSATIDPERLAEFFGEAPVLNVEGRGYPVEVRYRPPEEEGGDQPEAVERAVREIWREGPGDILVFLPGERDIRDCERHLSRALSGGKTADAEVLPLYARLNRAAQNRIFSGSSGRRIVLATNVAETSLTVPGIRYVIDTGLARISRYSTTAKVQRLPIEPVARASCDQRAGRCGRVAPGICIRLYGEDDYAARPEFTDPEIRRTNLASVLLTMADLRLGVIERFPFVDPPERRHIKDGKRLLRQLGAMEGDRITRLGHRLARLPLDPRIGRMLLAADTPQSVAAMRVLAAGLTIQDPRERPAEVREQADTAHAAFTDKRSDFISLLRLWDAFAQEKRARSGSQLRKWCREHFLNFMRLREWEDVVRQLRRLGGEVGLPNARPSGPLADSDYEATHRALLTGLLDHIGVHEERGDYLGARGRRFRIFPGSGLARRGPKWIVAAELIETSRLFAHTVAMVEPGWIEDAGAHLLKREHYEPHWEKRRGQVVARERVKLFGLTLSDGRRVDFGRIDPAVARELFIRDGLVAFELRDKRGRMPDFLAHNRDLVAAIEAREDRFRRRDLLVDEETQARFYEERLPPAVRDRTTLRKWLDRNDDALLRFDEETLLRHAGIELPEDAYPEVLWAGDIPIRLVYSFQPGTEQDGVTARLPLPALNQISPERAEWLVPGLLEDKVREYLKALPKSLRRSVVPVPDYARAAVERMPFADGRLETRLREAIRGIAGIEIPAEAWRDFSPSPHLRMRFEVLDDDGESLAADRDLAALRERFGAEARAAVRSLPSSGIEVQGLTSWPERDQLPDEIELSHGGMTLRAVPTLVDKGQTVDLELIDEPGKAARLHRLGVLRLLRLDAHKAARFLRRELDEFKTLAALPLPEAPETALADPAVLTAIEADDVPPLLADLLHVLIAARLGDTLPRDRAGFDAAAAEIGKHLVADAVELWDRLRPALREWRELQRRLSGKIALDWMPAIEDLREQLDHLVYRGCIAHVPNPEYLARYLAAARQRYDKLAQDGSARDRERMRSVAYYWAAYKKRAERAARRGERPEALLRFRWLVEEYRVQVFAQPLGTAEKVSPKRLDAALKDCR